MPHVQGYVYESYHCPDCGGNQWWPGLTCPECKGKGRADLEAQPLRNGPPIEPQPWQLQSLKWKQQEQAEQSAMQREHTALAAKIGRSFDHYRLRCEQHRLLALTASAEYVDRAVRALSPDYELKMHKAFQTLQGRMATAIIDCENVYRPDWARFYKAGWKPAKPLAVEHGPGPVRRRNESRRAGPSSESDQGRWPTAEELSEWEAYIKAEGLTAVYFAPDGRRGGPTADDAPVEVEAKIRPGGQVTPKQKWERAESVDKDFWKRLRRDID